MYEEKNEINKNEWSHSKYCSININENLNYCKN